MKSLFPRRSGLTAALLLAGGPAFAQSAAPAILGLDVYLKRVGEKNALVQSARLQKEAALKVRHPGDLAELSPFLAAEGAWLDDRQETLIPAQQGTRTRVGVISLGVSKKFATGTALSAQWGQTNTDIEGTAFLTPNWESRYSLGVSQSLWKDAFGRGIRLRHEREDFQTRLEILNADLQERQALIAAEEAYWNFSVQALDRREKADALARATKIRDWTARRLQDGIGDRADLLQIESLLATRRLSQIDGGDSFEGARRAVLDAMGAPVTENIEPSPDALSRVRALPDNAGDTRRLDAWIQFLAAKVSEKAARETDEALKPDLALQGAVGANARDGSYGTSTGDALATQNPYYRVGVKLTLNLDTRLVEAQRSAAQARAEAARLRADKAAGDTTGSWAELVRRHTELGSRIKAMEKLADAQLAQLTREQERLRVGRTTTFQVVTFEQNVADTRFALLQLRAQQRRLEANSQLFLSPSTVETL